MRVDRLFTVHGSLQRGGSAGKLAKPRKLLKGSHAGRRETLFKGNFRRWQGGGYFVRPGGKVNQYIIQWWTSAVWGFYYPKNNMSRCLYVCLFCNKIKLLEKPIYYHLSISQNISQQDKGYSLEFSWDSFSFS